MSETPVIEMTRRQLYDEIWEISVAGVAKKYDLKYSDLLKQMKEADIPIPPSGYWTKLSFGKPVEKLELAGDGDKVISIFGTAQDVHKRKGIKKPPEKEDIKIKSLAAIPLSKPPEVNAVLDVEVVNAEILQELGEPKTITQYGQTYNVYDRETLYMEVWMLPITEVAKKYKVSDVAIHKICKSLNIPTPPIGYWAKVRAGKPVSKQPPLPATENEKQKTGLQTGFTNPHMPVEMPSLDFLEEEDRVVVLAVSNQIQLTDENDKMHAKVITHRQSVLAWDKADKVAQKDWRGNRTDGKKPPLLWGNISMDSLPRVCRILDSLIKAMEPLGCTVTDDLQFVVRGETISISISESQTKIAHVLTKDEQREMLVYQDAQKRGRYAYKPNIRKYDNVYNGKLSFCIDTKKSISDGKSNTLENRLGEILISFYQISETLRLERIAKEEAERKRQQEEARKEERRKRYNAEVEHTNALMNAAEDYDAACKIRAYVDAIEAAGNLDEDKRDWIEWAKNKVDWLDPTVARDDEYFGKRKHEKSASAKELKESFSSWHW